MDRTKTLAIYGQSGHGKVVNQIALACGYEHIIWIDDNPDNDAITFETFLTHHRDIPIALGIGNNSTREKIYNKVKSSALKIITLIHPSAIIAEDCHIGEGSVLMPLVVVNTLAHLGKGTIINTHSCVEHECKLSDFVHLSPHVALGGNVCIAQRAHIGIGTSIIQGISIGNDTIIAAGSSVIQDIPQKVMAAGVPATIRKKLL